MLIPCWSTGRSHSRNGFVRDRYHFLQHVESLGAKVGQCQDGSSPEPQGDLIHPGPSYPECSNRHHQPHFSRVTHAIGK
jgi:hypothetical protein